MSWIPDFLLATPVTLNRMRTHNFDGSKVVSSSQTYKGRLVVNTDREVTVGSDLVRYNFTLYLTGDVDVQPDDQVVAMKGDEQQKLVVKSFDKHLQPGGQVDHTKLYLV